VRAGGKAREARYRYCMAADQATDGKAAAEVGKPQVFRSPTAVVVWIVWLLFAVANLIDLAVQGRDHISLVAAGILVMGTGVAYVAAQRPRLIVEDDALTVRNPLRDHRIPWPSISRVDVADLLRVHLKPPTGVGSETGAKKAKIITAWAVHYSRRRQISAEVKARRDAMRQASPRGARRTGQFGMSQFGIPQSRSSSVASYGSATQTEPEALKVLRLLNDRVAAAGIEEASNRDTDQDTILAEYGVSGGPLLTSTWNSRAILALVIPAVILLICCLV
jgi:hypothetical protein